MKKLTSLLTNMESVANEFQGKQCQCKQQGLVHERIEGSYKGKRRSRHAQVYPKPLVKALVSCCHTEMLRGESEIMAMRHEFQLKPAQPGCMHAVVQRGCTKTIILSWRT